MGQMGVFHVDYSIYCFDKDLGFFGMKAFFLLCLFLLHARFGDSPHSPTTLLCIST